MRYAMHLRRALDVGLVLALVLLGVAPVAAQNEKKDNSKKVPITTCDGVELEATLWPNAGGKKDATVLLLHNFDKIKGGSSHQDGWDDLADALLKEGYTVLSFDFRGFGNSRKVNKTFWLKPQNSTMKGALRRPPPETIDHKDFSQTYYLNLVNDIAAAKAYLDRQNDLKNLNSSNLIVIGAGEGASIGALWMATEFKRARSPGGFIGAGGLDEPEGKDLAGAVWLNISPTVAGRAVQPWLYDAGHKHKVPMLFMYGKEDIASEKIALGFLRWIVPNFKPDTNPTEEGYKFTRNFGVKNTKLTGSKLLTDSLDTVEIIKFYMTGNMEKRGAREARNRDMVKSSYFWVLGKNQVLPQPAKAAMEELPRTIPLRELQFVR